MAEKKSRLTPGLSEIGQSRLPSGLQLRKPGDGNNLEEVLASWGEEMRKEFVKQVRELKHTTPNNNSNLEETAATSNITIKGQTYSFSFFYQDYAEYLETGISAWSGGGSGAQKEEMLQSLIEWGKARGIIREFNPRKGVRKSKKTLEPLDRRWAKTIRHFISKKGTIRRFNYNGSKLLSRSFGDFPGIVNRFNQPLDSSVSAGIFAKMEADIVEAIKKDILVDINKTFQ